METIKFPEAAFIPSGTSVINNIIYGLEGSEDLESNISHECSYIALTLNSSNTDMA